MAHHEVKISLPNDIEVQRADVEFSVHRDGSKLGTLKISRGDVEWVPANHQHGNKVDWADFASFMENQNASVS